MQRLDKDQWEEMMQKVEIKEEKGKDQKQTLAGEDKLEKKQGRGKKVGTGDEHPELVTKKNNQKSKGMGVH